MEHSSRLRVLVTGANGQLGRSLSKVSPQFPAIELTATDLPEGDITRKDVVARLLEQVRPSVIINTAAYTAVEKAESDQQAAHLVNAMAPGILAVEAARRGLLLLHVSTDYVFDGSARIPIPEDAPTAPIGVYGSTKLEGEKAVQASGCAYNIVRTSWLYSEFGQNFVRTMLRLGTTRDELRVVADQQGCPTYATDLARALLTLATRPSRENQIFHFCNQGVTTWYQLAASTLKMAGITTPVLPVTTAEYPTAVRRPAYSALDTRKMEALGILNRPWEDALAECIGVLVSPTER